MGSRAVSHRAGVAQPRAIIGRTATAADSAFLTGAIALATVSLTHRSLSGCALAALPRTVCDLGLMRGLEQSDRRYERRV